VHHAILNGKRRTACWLFLGGPIYYRNVIATTRGSDSARDCERITPVLDQRSVPRLGIRKIASEPGVGKIDALIGNRIRARRLALNMDRETLGRAVGLNTAEITAHEEGATRVRAFQLSAMAEALKVSILFFFEDVPLL
jgi:hypothetical protein